MMKILSVLGVQPCRHADGSPQSAVPPPQLSSANAAPQPTAAEVRARIVRNRRSGRILALGGLRVREGSIAEHNHLLSELEEEKQRLRTEIDAARKSECDLRSELANVSSNVADKFKSEIELLQSQLAAAAKERTSLQAKIAKLQQEAEAAALVRDRVTISPTKSLASPRRSKDRTPRSLQTQWAKPITARTVATSATTSETQ